MGVDETRDTERSVQLRTESASSLLTSAANDSAEDFVCSIKIFYLNRLILESIN
jgi:hypothetical protein